MSIQQAVNAGTRLGSMLLDHFIMTMIAMVFFIPVMVNAISNAFSTTHEQADMDLVWPLLYVSFVGFAIYFCKDVINGRSIGKEDNKNAGGRQ